MSLKLKVKFGNKSHLNMHTTNVFIDEYNIVYVCEYNGGSELNELIKLKMFIYAGRYLVASTEKDGSYDISIEFKREFVQKYKKGHVIKEVDLVKKKIEKEYRQFTTLSGIKFGATFAGEKISITEAKKKEPDNIKDAALNARVDYLNAVIESQKEVIEDLNKKISHLKWENGVYEESIEDLNTHMQRREKKIREVVSENLVFKGDLEDYRTAVKHKNKEAAKLKVEREMCDSEIMSLKKEVNRHRTTDKNLRGIIEGYKEAEHKLRLKIAKLEVELGEERAISVRR